MKKTIHLILILFLIVLFPINAIGQFDFWMVEEMLQGEQGETIAEEQEIDLQDLSLYWSTNTYTPLTYEGRKLPSKGSLVNVFVDLKISGENPINLKFSWFLDGIFQEVKSGYGKDAFEFIVRKNNNTPHTVLLKIFNDSRSFVVQRSIEIPTTKAEIVLHEMGRGSYFAGQTNEKYYIKSGYEKTFIALPYFFDVEKLTDLEFTWTLPKQEPMSSSGYNANILKLTIGKESQTDLERDIRVEANKKRGIEQDASEKTKIYIY